MQTDYFFSRRALLVLSAYNHPTIARREKNHKYHMMRTITATTLLLFSYMHTTAQQNGVYYSLTAIAGDYHYSDATIESKPDGKRFGAAYNVTKKSRARQTTLELGWQGARIGGANEKYSVNEFSLQWSDGFKIGAKRLGNFSAFVGYSIHLNPSFAKATGKTNDEYTWSTVNTLGLYQSYHYNWQRQGLSLNVQVPLIGAASRPGLLTEYPDDMNGLLYDSYSNLQLISWDNYKDVALKLNYHRELTSRMQINAGLRYRYMELETVLPVKSRSLAVEAGVSFRAR